jgi:selenocysteine lyase/cysteine desulfurase
MVITTMASNVTGEVLPVKKIGALLKDLGIIYVVDGAQAGGHVEVSINDGISALCLAGHKGLYGLMSTGVLLFSEDIEISPLIYGGTGSFSTLKTQPETYPEKLESGTINLSGVASLYEGLNYVNKSIKNFGEILTSLTKKTIQGLSQIEGVRCYSLPNPVGIVSFLVKDLFSSEVSEALNSEFDIAVRGGLHCAPLLHTHLNTLETGLVRASFSAHNTSQEASSLVRAVKKIASRIKD